METTESGSSGNSLIILLNGVQTEDPVDWLTAVIIREEHRNCCPLTSRTFNVNRTAV
jgi:hypothetical protein